MVTQAKNSPVRVNAPALSQLLQKHGALLTLIMLSVLASFRYNSFLTPTNITNLSRQNSMLGYVVIGMTFVIMTGGIDLSVGSLLALSGIAAAILSPNGFFIALTVPILITTILGAVNGIIITKGRINPFIVTLAMMIGVRGFIYAYTSEKTVTVAPEILNSFAFLGRGVVLGVPVPFWTLLILLLLAGAMLNYTTFGRQILAVGGNEEASRLMGVNINRTRTLVYVISGFLSGLAGIVLASRLGGVAQPVAGMMWELDAVAAVVIGGTLLTGGKGSIFGSFVGVMLLGVILNIINMEGTIDSWWQPVIRGLFVVVIVVLQAHLHNKEKPN